MAARSDSASVRDLRALPKAHLHLHLEGAMRPATLHELAAEHGIRVPPVQGFGSFAAFAGQYVAACAVLRRPDDLHRLVREVAEDAAAAGAIWVEPALYLPRHRAVYGSDEAVLEQALAAARAAEAATGVGVGLILAADRTEAPAEALGCPTWRPATPGAGWSPSGWPTTRSATRPSRSPRRLRSRAPPG